MAESSRRKVVVVNKRDIDIISDLPPNIIESILELLPIRDAVRTSILSRKWRYNWTTLSRLVFDSHFISTMVEYVIRLNLKDSEARAHEFVSVINKLLLLHNAPILKFSLRIPNHYNDVEKIGDYVNQWIHLLSTNPIKDLTIDNECFVEFMLHSRVFSCQELTHLKLQGVQFGHIPACGGFSYLTNLNLESLINLEGFSFYIKCPLLESLTLKHCVGVSHLNFHAPNLKRLYVKGFPIPFRSTESIQVFSMHLSYPQEDLDDTIEYSNMVEVLGRLPSIVTFSVKTYFLQYLSAGGVPERLSIPMYHLKNLTITGVNFTSLSEVSCLLCLLRSAPNLCKLEISAMGIQLGNRAALDNFRVEDNVNCMLSQLQVVRLNHLHGLRAELEIIKFLLAQSPVLQTMFIHRNEAIKTDAALIMAEEMMEFPRASPKLLFKHLKDPRVPF